MAMRSFLRRLLALASIAAATLLLLCVAASLTDNLRYPPTVSASGEVLKINRFRKRLNGNDEVSMNLNISVDFGSAFTWNTKQVFVFVAAEYATLQNSFNQISLWDQVIPDREHAKFQIQPKNRYLLIDQGSHLLGKEIDIVLHWHILPKTGRIFQDKMSLSNFSMPNVYI